MVSRAHEEINLGMRPMFLESDAVLSMYSYLRNDLHLTSILHVSAEIKYIIDAANPKI